VNEKEQVTFADAIRLAISDEMGLDSSVILFGLGVNDPGRVFGTTKGLVEKFGDARVFETPTAENSMTGVAVGAALAGLRPIAVHQRFDFFLLAMDQIVNSAAKWNFMFGGQFSVPLVVRVIVGRGWGQGPTHSQNFQSWMTQVPGLKVVCPSSPQSAYDLMRTAIRDNNPVIFIEHRWLHNAISTDLRRSTTKESISKIENEVLRSGDDVTVAAYGIGILDAIDAAQELAKIGYSIEILDLHNFSGSFEYLYASAIKTRKLVLVDHGLPKSSFGSWIISKFALDPDLRDVKVDYLSYPHMPEATSRGLLSSYHPNSSMILNAALKLLELNTRGNSENNSYKDVPDDKYRGPF
jgi:pyruvate dehydrogenase E1 component beta subunit